MKTPRLMLILGLAILLPRLVAGQDQQASLQNGILQIVNWPENAYNQTTYDSLITASEILPLIDTLTIGYNYSVAEGNPVLSYTLSWQPEGRVYLAGQEHTFETLAGNVYIESLVIRAEVIVDGAKVGMLTLGHDSLMAEPFPGQVAFAYNDLTWETLFDGIEADSARVYFDKGFALTNPIIAKITFVSFEEEVASTSDNTNERRRRPSRRTIYQPGVSIWVDYPVYWRPRPHVVVDRTRTLEPRGRNVGRGDATTAEDRRNTDRREGARTTADGDDGKEDTKAGDILSGRKKKKDDDDEDDEDEGDLMPAAVAGVAIIAAAAIIGGTIGYYGNLNEAPIGLMTGYVKPGGGVLLQVAVNNAVLEKSKVDAEHFLGRLTGFYDMFGSPVQPAIGVGALVMQQNNEVDYTVSISPGLVGNFGRLVVLAGVDVVSGGVDVGMAYNFRARRR